LLDVLREVKKGLPEDLTATGTVRADLSFVADGMGAGGYVVGERQRGSPGAEFRRRCKRRMGTGAL